MAMNFEPNECAIVAQSTKIGTHENKAIHSSWNIAECDLKPQQKKPPFIRPAMKHWKWEIYTT